MRRKRKYPDRGPVTRRERAMVAAEMLKFDAWLAEANSVMRRIYCNEMRDDMTAALERLKP